MECIRCNKKIEQPYDMIRFFTREHNKYYCNGYARFCEKCSAKFEKKFIRFIK